MESRSLDRLFRRLFSHDVCGRLRHTRSPQARHHGLNTQRRGYAYSRSKEADPNADSDWQQRTEFYPPDKLQDYNQAPWVTAKQLRLQKNRPRGVKMLMREFIDDSLYNPNYGYFPKQATIFSPPEPYNFNSIRNEPAFFKIFAKQYEEFEDKLDEEEYNHARQVWHTPSDLFRPYYGETLARYIVENYRLTQFPYHDLIIYEMGAGNGTLMLNILDHIREVYPDVYDRTRFRVIEISDRLADLQSSRLNQSPPEPLTTYPNDKPLPPVPLSFDNSPVSHSHADHVEIVRSSIFDWDAYVPEPCWFLAQEVADNFAHDAIRYDPFKETPLQATVLIDKAGDFYEFYTPEIDPIAKRYLSVRSAACESPFAHPLAGSKWLRRLRASLPLSPNLSLPEYIPTRLMQFFDVLAKYFPQHRLLMSDFDKLPDTIDGYNAPVVQTRFERRTIPVSTPLVQQGYFDILFPTDFTVMEDVYRAITGKLTRVSTQAEFLQRWAYTEDTRTRSGENPMLSWYSNASVMVTV